MRIIIYEVLTQLIACLAGLRDFFSPQLFIRSDRICGTEHTEHSEQKEMNGIPFTCIECCDCNLRHYFWLERGVFFGMPLRPEKYRYHLRFLSKPSCLATKEMLRKMIAMKEFE